MKTIRPLHIIVFVMTVIAMSLVLSVPSEAAEKRLALVIGNDGYKLKPLSGPVNDAIDMEKALRKLGFEVIISTEAGQSEMLRAIGQFGEKLRKADVGLFYYSGHGVQNKGENYLIPTDTEKEILQSEVNLRFKAVPAAIITDTMNEAGNRLNIVILDACRSNPYSKGFKSMRKGLAKMDGTSGMFIAYAAEADKEAEAAGSDSRNSIYTAHLLKHIGVPGLPMERMFKEVRKGVLKDTGNEQRPCEYGSITDDFYFNGEGGQKPEQERETVTDTVKKPKYQLRKTPMTVSEDEALTVFRLKKNEKGWRIPLEYVENDFKDNGDGTITDRATGLMWQKSGSPDEKYPKDVPAYIEKLNREKFAGYTDWRLPTVDELKSLLTTKEINGVYIDPIFDKTQRWCWTSDQRSSGGAWSVNFYDGCVYWGNVYFYVRAVRSLQ